MKRKKIKLLELNLEKIANLTIIRGGTNESEDTNCGSETKKKSKVVRQCPNSGIDTCPILRSRNTDCPPG